MMVRSVRIIVTAVLAAGLLAAAVPAEAVVDYQRQLDQRMREEEQLQRDMDSATRNLAAAENEIRALESQLAQIESDLRRTEAELADLNDQVALAEKRVEDARENLQRTEEELEYRTGLMRERVRTMYERGPVNYLEVLLASTSFYDFLSRMELMRQVVQADVELFHHVSELRDEAEARRNALEEEADQLAQLRDQVARKRQQLDAQIASRQATLAQVNSRKAHLNRQLDQMERDAQRLTDEIFRLQTTIEAYRREGELAFVWPLQNPRGWVSSPFGMRYHPILRRWSMHTGLDIAAPSGTIIVAAEEGRVIFAQWFGAYGLMVVVDHGKEVHTMYAHASRILVSAGDIVSRGQPIARVGTTGLSTGPHLHFEIRINNQVVDPRPRLP